MIQKTHDDTFSWQINKAYGWWTLSYSWCHRHWNRTTEDSSRRVFEGGIRPKTRDTKIMGATKVLLSLKVGGIRSGRHGRGREICRRWSHIGGSRRKGRSGRLGRVGKLLGQWSDIGERSIGKADGTIMRGWLGVTRKRERLDIGRIEGGGWAWRIDRDWYGEYGKKGWWWWTYHSRPSR